MKRSRAERRADALARLKASTFENSRAARKGESREEWQARKDEELRHLEEIRGHKA